jgi:eight-cysteine-cluster-containing protein
LALTIGTIGAACSPLRPPKDTPLTGAPVSTPQQEGSRVAALLPSASNFDHFEGVAFRNSCDEDSACHLGGCSNEICSADAEVTSTCIEYPDKPTGAACGCVKGQCLWYVTGAVGEDMAAKQKAAATAAAAAAQAPRPRADAGPTSTLPEQGQPCADGRCAPGLECLTFFGVAGPKGGTQNSCELRCGGGRQCPRGQSCATISDGPGSVCRDESQFAPQKK